MLTTVLGMASTSALRERHANVVPLVGRSKAAQSLFALTKEELAKQVSDEHGQSTEKVRKALLAASRAKRAAASEGVESAPRSQGEVLADIEAKPADNVQDLESVQEGAPVAKVNVDSSEESSSKLHTKIEASLLVRDAQLHEWLSKRQRKNQPAKPRMYMTRHRRSSLRKTFESIDRDNSGSIDREELVFALQHLGLDHKLAGAIFAEGDTDGDGVITLDEFYSLVATVSARERQREALQEQQLARQRHLEKQQERQQLAHHRKGECDYKAKEEARQAQSIGGGIARAATKKATKSLLPLELDVLTPRTQQAEAVAASINELVSKASSFPIGLLANAQQLNTLVAGFNPEGYAERALAAEERCERHHQGSLRAAGKAVLAASRLTNHDARLPALLSGTRAGSSRELARAASAPASQQNTAHKRWLQRAMTSKDPGAEDKRLGSAHGKAGRARAATQRASSTSSDITLRESLSGSYAPSTGGVESPPTLQIEDQADALEIRTRPASSPMRLRAGAESAKATFTWGREDHIVAHGAMAARAPLQRVQTAQAHRPAQRLPTLL